MKRRVFFFLIAAFFSLPMMAGCAPAPVDEHDLEKVNFYAQSAGAEPIGLDAAEEMNECFYKQAATGDVKTSWELVVDYVVNANSEEPEPLDYAFEFDGESYALANDNTWERIGED